MDLTWEERPSDSLYIERVWRSRSDYVGTFISMAEIHQGMVVTTHQGKITMTVRGPETRATPALSSQDTEWVGIQFSLGTTIPPVPPRLVMDRRDLNLPDASDHAFWLYGSAWQFPDYENAETFVEWLARAGLLVHDPVVRTVLQGQPAETSLRSVQRRFLRATGLTYSVIAQIARARYATSLLKQGLSILDTVDQAGYADQPHMTRSLRRFVGQTPAQIANQRQTEPLSFLFKTPSF